MHYAAYEALYDDWQGDLPVDEAPASDRGTTRWLHRVGLAALFAVAAFIWLPQLAALLPGNALPYNYVVVAGSSMEPAYHDGDIVLLAHRSEYDRGDTIAYRVPDGDIAAGSVVIHRVVDGSARDGYVTQGDNRDGRDLWRPRNEDTIGEAVVRLPGAGTPLAFARTQAGLAVLAAVIAVTLAAGCLRGGARPPARRS